MSEHCINQTRKKNQTNIIKRSKANYKNKNIQMNTLKQRSALNKKKYWWRERLFIPHKHTKQANREQEIHLHTCSSWNM